MGLRYIFRKLSSTPGFTAMAVATLALGIGINTVVFTIYASVAFRQLPVRAPDEMVRLRWRSGGFPSDQFSWSEYERLADNYPIVRGGNRDLAPPNNFLQVAGFDRRQCRGCAGAAGLRQLFRRAGDYTSRSGGPSAAMIAQSRWSVMISGKGSYTQIPKSMARRSAFRAWPCPSSALHRTNSLEPACRRKHPTSGCRHRARLW